MKRLIDGAGTIGLVYIWLLSSLQQVDVLFRSQRIREAQKGYDLMLIDKCEKPEMLKRFHYSPKSLPGSKTIMT